jgi:hypothetical protein
MQTVQPHLCACRERARHALRITVSGKAHLERRMIVDTDPSVGMTFQFLLTIRL